MWHEDDDPEDGLGRGTWAAIAVIGVAAIVALVWSMAH
jgi:hypothetical protein